MSHDTDASPDEDRAPRSSHEEPVTGHGAPLRAIEIDMMVAGPHGPRHLLQDMSLALVPGEIAVVTGRTGSGKSTLLRILAGFLRPQAGDVLWEGRSLRGASAEEVTRRRRGFLSYLDQASPVIEGLTALEAVAVGAGPLRRRERAAARQRARSLCERLDLDHVVDHDVGTVSGGERQRIALASLLMSEPKVLLLDELTSALDEATTHTTVAYLHELAQEGAAIAVSSHDPLVIDAADVVYPL